MMQCGVLSADLGAMKASMTTQFVGHASLVAANNARIWTTTVLTTVTFSTTEITVDALLSSKSCRLQATATDSQGLLRLTSCHISNKASSRYVRPLPVPAVTLRKLWQAVWPRLHNPSLQRCLRVSKFSRCGLLNISMCSGACKCLWLRLPPVFPHHLH